MLILKSLGKK